MHRIIRAICAGIALSVAAPVVAQQTYTTRAAFNAATSGRTVIDFNGEAAGGATDRTPSFTAGGVTFTGTGGTQVNTVGSQNGFGGGDQYGSGYFEWQGATRTVTVTLPSPSIAVGFDYIGLSGSGVQYTVTVNGVASTFMSGAAPQFFGTKAAAPFTTLTIQANVNAPTMDNFTFATSAAPEPAAWGLMILGFGAAGQVLRRKRAKRSLATA